MGSQTKPEPDNAERAPCFQANCLYINIRIFECYPTADARLAADRSATEEERVPMTTITLGGLLAASLGIVTSIGLLALATRLEGCCAR